MALASTRRARARGFEGLVLPGFVDALASLLLVVIFVLMAFFLIQTGLGLRVTGQDTILANMRTEIARISALLDDERGRATRLDVEGREITTALEAAETRGRALDARISELESGLAELDATRNKNEAEITALNFSLDDLRAELNATQTELDDKEAALLRSRQAAASATRELLDAISSRPAELHRLRGVFFARLGEAIETGDGISLPGDRLVLAKEAALFAPGSAELTDRGETRLGDIGAALAGIIADIAADDGWVLAVSVHAERRELAAARALAVVRFLVTIGYDEARLVATGGHDDGNPRTEFRMDTR